MNSVATEGSLPRPAATPGPEAFSGLHDCRHGDQSQKQRKLLDKKERLRRGRQRDKQRVQSLREQLATVFSTSSSDSDGGHVVALRRQIASLQQQNCVLHGVIAELTSRTQSGPSSQSPAQIFNLYASDVCDAGSQTDISTSHHHEDVFVSAFAVSQARALSADPTLDAAAFADSGDSDRHVPLQVIAPPTGCSDVDASDDIIHVSPAQSVDSVALVVDVDSADMAAGCGCEDDRLQMDVQVDVGLDIGATSGPDKASEPPVATQQFLDFDTKRNFTEKSSYSDGTPQLGYGVSQQLHPEASAKHGLPTVRLVSDDTRSVAVAVASAPSAQQVSDDAPSAAEALASAPPASADSLGAFQHAVHENTEPEVATTEISDENKELLGAELLAMIQAAPCTHGWAELDDVQRQQLILDRTRSIIGSYR